MDRSRVFQTATRPFTSTSSATPICLHLSMPLLVTLFRIRLNRSDRVYGRTRYVGKDYHICRPLHRDRSATNMCISDVTNAVTSVTSLQSSSDTCFDCCVFSSFSLSSLSICFANLKSSSFSVVSFSFKLSCFIIAFAYASSASALRQHHTFTSMHYLPYCVNKY